MKLRYLLVLSVSMMSVIAAAQTAAPKPAATPKTTPKATIPAKPATPAKPEAAQSKLAPTTPVITVSTPCEKTPNAKPATADAKPATCTQSITRAEFEKLVDIVSPGMNPTVRRNFAQNLARLLVFSAEAKRQGLDKTDRSREMLKFTTMQVYSQELARKTQDEAAKVPDAEVDTYYRENPSKFEELTLSRIVVPKRTSGSQPVNEDEEKAFAQKIRDRWAAGEDADKLEKEAFEHAASTSPMPPIQLGTQRAGALPPSHEGVYKLKPGEVSQPIAGISNFVIYRLESKRVAPLDDKSREEIKRAITAKRIEAAIAAITDNSKTTLDTAYFEAGTPDAVKPAAKQTPAAAPAAQPEPKPATPKEPEKK